MNTPVRRGAQLAGRPHARIVGYRGKLFRGEATVLKAGTLVREAAGIGYPQHFASLELQCQA